MQLKPKTNRFRNVVAAFQDGIGKSPFGRIELSDYPVILDFIADRLLHSAEVAKCFHLVFLSAISSDGHCLAENLVALCTSRLPRRGRPTLLHEAAKESSEGVAKLCLGVIGKFMSSNSSGICDGHIQCDFQDDDRKTPFFYAAESGNRLLCELLLVNHADVNVLAYTTPVLRVVKGEALSASQVSPFLSIDKVQLKILSRATPAAAELEPNDMPSFKETCYVVAIPTLQVSMQSSGFFMYEVEVKQFAAGNFMSLHLGWIEQGAVDTGSCEFNQHIASESGKGGISVDVHTRKCLLNGENVTMQPVCLADRFIWQESEDASLDVVKFTRFTTQAKQTEWNFILRQPAPHVKQQAQSVSTKSVSLPGKYARPPPAEVCKERFDLSSVSDTDSDVNSKAGREQAGTSNASEALRSVGLRSVGGQPARLTSHEKALTTDFYGVAIDATKKFAYFGKNGEWYKVNLEGFDAALGGIMVPAVSGGFSELEAKIVVDRANFSHVFDPSSILDKKKVKDKIKKIGRSRLIEELQSSPRLGGGGAVNGYETFETKSLKDMLEDSLLGKPIPLIHARVGQNVLMAAAKQAAQQSISPQIIDFLLGSSNMLIDNLVDLSSGRTIAHYAVGCKSTSLLNRFFDQFQDSRDQKGQTPLLYALEKGFPDIALSLLDRGGCRVDYIDNVSLNLSLLCLITEFFLRLAFATSCLLSCVFICIQFISEW